MRAFFDDIVGLSKIFLPNNLRFAVDAGSLPCIPVGVSIDDLFCKTSQFRSHKYVGILKLILIK